MENTTYSFCALLEYCDNPDFKESMSTAKYAGIKTACRSIADDLLPEESADVRRIVVENVTERYRTRKNPAKKTLAEYRGRIKTAIASFVSHVDESTEAVTAVVVDQAEKVTAPVPERAKSQPNTAKAVKPSQPSNTLQVMIRPDFLVQVILPFDLTPAEAKHVARLIEAIPMQTE